MPTVQILLILLLAMPGLSALEPFFFYAENTGLEEPAVKYRLYNVSTRIYLGANAIHMRDGYTQRAIRFAAGEPAGYQSLERWPGVLNRFEGESRSWQHGIPAHRRVQYTSIAPHVDAVFGAGNDAPTLTFVVRPGGDVNSLFLQIDGVEATVAEPAGTWTIGSFPQWTVNKPRAWQEIRGAASPVDTAFRRVSPSRVDFTTGAFDPTQPLYVEVAFPATVFPAWAPGEFGVSDKAGNVYAPKETSSDRVCSTNPIGMQNFCSDAAVGAVRPDGEPIFLTVLGGAFDDLPASPLFVDGAGNVVMAGRTGSADFPVTANAEQPVNAGPIGPFPRTFPYGGDLFLSILDSKSGDLTYSTFLGGPERETLLRITGGYDGSVALVLANAAALPPTPGAWLTEGELAITVLDPSRRRVRFTTFLPAGVSVTAVRAALDSSVYITGTSTGGAPTTKGALQPDYGGGANDGYLVRLAPDGTRALYATYFGGSAGDELGQFDLASNGDLWIHGTRRTAGFEGSESFLVHLSGEGTQLAGPLVALPAQSVADLRVMAGGEVAVLGYTGIMAAHTTAGAFLRGGCDASGNSRYFQVFRGDGTLRYASYLLPLDSRGIEAIYAESLRPFTAGAPIVHCLTGGANRRNYGQVAPGEIVTLLGSGLGPVAGVSTAPGPDGRYPTTVAGVRVLADGVPIPLLYVEGGQINAIMPFSIQPGNRLPITVEVAGMRLAPVVSNITPAAFSLFALSDSATAARQAVAINEDGRLNSRLNPAPPGSIVVVYGTGAGVTSPASVDGALAPLGPLEALPRPLGRFAVLLPGLGMGMGEVLYAGAAPGLVNGLIQVNFRLPASTVSSDDSPVLPAFSINGGTMLSGQAVIWVGGSRP